MIRCEMTGCHDMASYTLKTKDEELEVCRSCAYWWRYEQRVFGTITSHANKERELTK
jgi:hypothetical protein